MLMMKHQLVFGLWLDSHGRPTIGKTSSLKREESINAHLPVEILFGRLGLGKVAPLVLFAWSQCCPEK